MAGVTLTLSELLRRAMSAYEAGDLSKAAALCQKVIEKKHDHCDALHLLAIVQSRLGKNEEALANFDHALAIRPDYAEALNNRGNTLITLKHFGEALTSYDRALAIRPDYAEALNNRGVTLKEMKRYEEALASYNHAITARSHYAEAFYNRGVIQHELKQFQSALASYDHALAARPDYAEAHNNRGNVLRDLKRYDEALASYNRALDVRQDYAEALNNRGVTLHELRRHEEALKDFDRALIIRPRYTEALNNRSNTLHQLNRLEDALDSSDRALALRSDYAEALNNRGNNLVALNRAKEALASYDRAIVVRPSYAEAHWNNALTRLLLGDFNQGWPEYEWRWKTDTFPSARRNFGQTLWLGKEPIAGKTILLHCEQGFGDTIQFCRYVPLVAALGARILFEVPRPLNDLMMVFSDIAQMIVTGSKLPDFEFQCPLASLPLAFGTRFNTIPAAVPYLSVPKNCEQKWQQRLPQSVLPRIGINWAGNPKYKSDGRRSIGLTPMLPLLATPQVQFFGIQKDLRATDPEILQNNGRITHLGGEIDTFGDTAAIIASMDLIISSDTSVVHLAGALAKPVWVLLPFIPDWRWLLDRNDSPWYPTARLFRQDEARDWRSVIQRVHMALRGFNWKAPTATAKMKVGAR